MPLNGSIKGATTIKLLTAGSKADTAAATGTGIDISEYEGYMVVTQNVGAVAAGTIVGKLQSCSAADGTDAADITGAVFTSCGTTTDETCESVVIKVDGLQKYLRYVGTIVTGAAIVGVSAVGVKKYV